MSETKEQHGAVHWRHVLGGKAGCGPTDRTITGEDRQRLELARKLIEQSIAQAAQVDMSEIIRKSGYRRMTFYRRYHDVYGATPRRHIVFHRVNLAAELALRGISGEELARRCGYGDYPHLAREFRREVGKTLTAFRDEKIRERNNREASQLASELKDGIGASAPPWAGPGGTPVRGCARRRGGGEGRKVTNTDRDIDVRLVGGPFDQETRRVDRDCTLIMRRGFTMIDDDYGRMIAHPHKPCYYRRKSKGVFRFIGHNPPPPASPR